jgi:hypothetical protein
MDELEQARQEAVAPWEGLALETGHHYSMPHWVDGAFRIYFGPHADEVYAGNDATEAARWLCSTLGIPL